MAYRVAALASFVLTLGFVFVYWAAAQVSEDEVARWYVVTVGLGALALLVSLARPGARVALVIAVVVLSFGVLAGILTVGLLLLPAVAAAAFARYLLTRQPHPTLTRAA